MSPDTYAYYASPDDQQWGGWTGLSSTIARFMSISFFASLLSNPYIFDTMKLFVMGTILESGRRFCQWLMERVRFQYSITAQFDEGDPAYEWIILFLTEKEVWRQSKEFRVTAKSSKRQWSVKAGGNTVMGHAEYVPTYQLPQLFWWDGYFVEIKRNKGVSMMIPGHHSSAAISLTIYTRDMNVMSKLVDNAYLRYIEVSRPNVIIHTVDNTQYGPGSTWNNVKRKARRPLSSIVLQDGMMESLLEDAHEFLGMEDWYIEAGIPYRRGYLLYGPPGTGKSSTIYALAGELGLEIYSLSLASGFVDDMFLQKAASSIPKKAIFLIEDIDCAFPSREGEDDEPSPIMHGYAGMVTPGVFSGRRKSAVTLSGLLNVLDGVGSEEGKLFFATTNYVDHLDPALIRPGRIDKKIQYKLATATQAKELFIRFFPEAHVDLEDMTSAEEKTLKISQLAEIFSECIPEHELSTAELQGYLLGYKRRPDGAAENIEEWIQNEENDRKLHQQREESRKKKAKEVKERREINHLQGSLTRLGVSISPPPMYAGSPAIPSITGLVLLNICQNPPQPSLSDQFLLPKMHLTHPSLTVLLVTGAPALLRHLY
ncbi:P-loop containing nucleoside triphosphate hydrolase protein [Cyathus striatus]|nr:P-loop containing nucleoside triphosphate hydrolase protein [Cyathus striatus]